MTAPQPSAAGLNVAALDFCALGPKGNGGAFERQRVVMLDVAEDASLRSGAEVEFIQRGKESSEVPLDVLRSIRPFEHAREMLLSVFPMKRLYLVLAHETPGKEFSGRQPVEVTQARALVASDPHVAHSLDCADWLAAPYMARGKVVWSHVERERTVIDANGKSRQVKYIGWEVSVPMTARLEVYRRSGTQFVHHATLEATPQGTAANDSLDWNDPSVHETVSVTMAPGCITPGMSRADIANALRRCGGSVPRVSPTVESPTLGGFARGSHYCEGIDDVVRDDRSNMPAIARCELRVAAEYLAVDLQLKGKRMCGWRLFSPLLEVPYSQERGVSMGEHEGAERGAYFVAYATTGQGGCGDGSAEEGYGRLTSVGPGGERGFKQPSILHFQVGNPNSGVRMEELAMHGLRFGVKAATSLMLARGNLDSSAVFGALIEGGYDLSRYIPLLDETWVKADLGFLFGSETFLPLSLSFESVSYVGNRVAVFGDIGFAWTAVSKSIDMGPVEPNATLSGSTFGGRIAAGLNYSIRPEWNARVVAEARSGFSSAKLTDDKYPNVMIDGGPLLMAMISVSMSYTH